MRFLALLLTVITFISCDDPFKRQDFYLSNPTDASMQLTLDDQAYTLAPQSVELVKLKAGVHELIYKEQKHAFTVFQQNSGGIINPALEPHYIYSMVYATEGNFDKFGSTRRAIEIDGVPYEDNIKVTNALFIDNNLYRCTYFLGEAYPEEQITYNKNTVGNFFNKFFTKAEFIAFYDEAVVEEDRGFHQLNRVENGNCTITEPSENAGVTIPNIPNEELVASYKKEVELLEEFKKSTDASKQKSIQKELFDLAMSRAKLEINYSELTTEQNQAMNDFVHASGRISGAGILKL